MNDMIEMRSVAFLQGFQIRVALSDGNSYLYDMCPKLKTVRFYELSDWNLFSGGYIRSGQTICWDNGTELYMDEIVSAGK